MSLTFWLDSAAYAISAAIALALTFIVLGTGPKRALNRLFALFVLAVVCWAASALLMRITLWLQAGNPVRILELSVLGFALIGPTLLMFTVRYVGRPTHWADLAAALGLAVTAALATPLFRDQIVFNLRSAADLTQPYYDVSPWGFVLATLPAAYMTASLALFWRNRHRTQEPYLAAGVLIMLAGFIVGGLFQPRFPVMSFTTILSVAILGYGIISRQIFNPLRDLSAELEQKVEERTYELEAEHNFVSTVLNTARALVVVLDAQGHIIRFNRACEQVTGYSFDEVQGRHLWDVLLTPEDAASARVGFDNPHHSEFPRESESYWLTKDGGRRLIAWSNSVLLDDEGAAEYVIGTGIDVTERVQAEEKLRRSLEEAAHNQRLLLALSRAAQAVQRARTPKEVYRTIGDEIVKLGLHTTAFTLSDDRTHLVGAHMTFVPTLLRAAEKLTGISAQGYRFPLKPGGFYERTAIQGETIFSDPGAEPIAEALPRAVRPLAGRLATVLGLEKAIYVPLKIGGEPHGLMTVLGSELTEADVPAVSAFASQVTIAIENARLYQSAQQEIAERKRTEASLRASEERFRQMAELLPEIVFEMDVRGVVTFVNQQGLKATGYTQEDLVRGFVGTDLFVPAEREIARKHIARMLTENRSASFEYTVQRKDDSTFPVATHTAPIIRDGKPAGLRGILFDITERKRAEERLARYAAGLEQANEELKRFTYVASHNLRGPLVNLKGFAAELRAALAVVGSATVAALPHLDTKQRQKAITALEHDIPEALNFIDTSTSELDRLVSAIQKLSFLNQEDLRLKPIDTDALVQATLQTLSTQIEEHQAQVAVGPLPGVVADRVAMEQIWGNLLGNAVKYLDPDRSGKIEIAAERNHGETTFHVRDNGRGIATDDMDKVFAPFRRAGKQDVPGEGMGLAYVQTLVRRHGGRIWYESEPGVGTTFSFTIPNHDDNSELGRERIGL